jgi:hypothetical protein
MQRSVSGTVSLAALIRKRFVGVCTHSLDCLIYADFVILGTVYNKALLMLQETLRQEAEAGQYSEHLLRSLACITATASFSGMFKAAELHCDAMIRVLTMRGDGDIMKGLQITAPWTSKAVQW